MLENFAPFQEERHTRFLVGAIITLSAILSITMLVFNVRNVAPNDYTVSTAAKAAPPRRTTTTSAPSQVQPGTTATAKPHASTDRDHRTTTTTTTTAPKKSPAKRPQTADPATSAAPSTTTTAAPATVKPTTAAPATPTTPTSAPATTTTTAPATSAPATTTTITDTPLQYGHLTLWSSDFSVDAIRNVRNVARVSALDHSLSSECHVHNSCQRDLRVIDGTSAVRLGREGAHGGRCAPVRLKRRFFDEYARNGTADAFMCNQPASMCELFMSLGKPLLVYAVTRYDMGRWGEEELQMWNKNLQLIANNDWNVIAASNRYDAKYIQYFTGLRPLVIPFYCKETLGLNYEPTTSNVFLIGPGELPKKLQERLDLRAEENGVVLRRFEELNDWRHNLKAFTSFKAVIWIPTDVTSVLMTHLYRMNVPLFVPSIPLLASWVKKYEMMEDRTWKSVLGSSFQESLVPAHPSIRKQFDPNDSSSIEALEHWLKYADFYQWKHIQTFSSFKDLTQQLSQQQEENTLETISKSMAAENIEIRNNIIHAWKQVFDQVSHHQQTNPKQASPFSTFDEAMKKLYKGEAPLEAGC